MNPEDLLSDAFRDRTAHTDYPSTPMSTVATRAGAIRARRRRTTVLAAAATVALVAVPSALWLGRSPGSSPQPGRTTSSGPTTQPTAHLGPVSLDALPRGPKPGIDYLVGDTYVTMNGDRMSSPDFATAGTATPARGGILTATAPPRNGPFVLSRISLVNGAQSQDLGCGAPSFAMSTDGTESAYWVADSCTTLGRPGKLYSGVNNTMGDSGPAYVATPPRAIDEPIGIVRQGVVVNDIGGDVANGPAGFVIGWDGKTNPLPTLVYAGGSDENNDVVSGSAGNGDGAVVRMADGSVVCRAPAWQLGQFSNDGKYVLGTQPVDGFPYDIYGILDASTCAVVTTLHIPGATQENGVTIGHPAWDFNDTVLAVADSTEGSTIVRFDLQGHLTRATSVSDIQGDYRLATRP